jgi:hypothetical protein
MSLTPNFSQLLHAYFNDLTGCEFYTPQNRLKLMSV